MKIQPAVFFRALSLSAALTLCLTSLLPGRAVNRASPAESIPKIARIAGIKVGYTTRERLEACWGEGKTVVGGHSNGARLWRVKGTNWVIYADAFEYEKNGIVVDSLDISTNQVNASDAPFVKVSAASLAWLGGVSLGMTEEKVLAVLLRKSLPVQPTSDGWTTSATGFHDLGNVNREKFQSWTVRLDFEGKVLVGLSLDAR